jgi:hypothetical protein
MIFFTGGIESQQQPEMRPILGGKGSPPSADRLDLRGLNGMKKDKGSRVKHGLLFDSFQVLKQRLIMASESGSIHQGAKEFKQADKTKKMTKA